MNNRNSHWPIYDVVPLELIESVLGTVRNAQRGVIKSKDGMVVYFTKREKDWNGERGKIDV